MAMTATPVFAQTPKSWGAQILPADTTALKTIVTGGANGTKVEMLIITSTDTAARDVQIFLHDGTTAYLQGTIPVAINAGNINTTTATGLLATVTATPFLPFLQWPMDSNGNRYIYLPSGWSLRAAVLTAVTAAKAISITATGGDF